MRDIPFKMLVYNQNLGLYQVCHWKIISQNKTSIRPKIKAHYIQDGFIGLVNRGIYIWRLKRTKRGQKSINFKKKRERKMWKRKNFNISYRSLFFTLFFLEILVNKAPVFTLCPKAFDYSNFFSLFRSNVPYRPAPWAFNYSSGLDIWVLKNTFKISIYRKSVFETCGLGI